MTGEQPGDGPQTATHDEHTHAAATDTPATAPPRKSWKSILSALAHYLALGLRGLLILAVVLAVGFAATYWWPVSQSYVVDVATRGLSLTFDGGSISAWRLGPSTLCIRKRGGTPPPAQLPSRATPDCPDQLYWPVGLDHADVQWAEGTRADLRITGAGGVVIDLVATAEDQRIQTGEIGIAVPPFSRIIVSPQAWAVHPALPFSSTDIGIGNVPGAGEEGIVMEGKYEMRQTLALRSTPITVDQGIFYTGDRVGFEPGRPLVFPPMAKEPGYQVYGFVAPLAEPSGSLAVVAYSALSRATLRIERLGVEPRLVQADWTHRAVRDPILLALAAFLSVSAVLSPFGLLWFLAGRIATGRKDVGPDPDAPAASGPPEDPGTYSSSSR